MSTWVWIVIAAAAVLLLVLIAVAVVRRRKTTKLRDTFGPEYERTVADAPTKREAEAELKERELRHEEFELQPLSPSAREGYLASWERVQARFVDDPGGAVHDADRLIREVMNDRGYPVEDFDQRAADLSVDYPELVQNYRAAHGISRRNDDGEAETEELRQAVVHYRALFEELLEARAGAETTSRT
jgi:hypothetical protein